MDRRLGIVVQARTGSSRLPEKVLLPLSGKPLIIFIVDRLRKVYDIPLIVATTIESNDDKLIEVLEENNIQFFRGSENNVLNRFIDAANDMKATDIIRICADNPFLEISFLNELIRIWNSDTSNDYLSFEYKSKPVILSHFGIFAEIVKVSALSKVKEAYPNSSFYKEHVTNGIYLNPGEFKIKLISKDDVLHPLEGMRLTIDTMEDYKNICLINEMINELSLQSISEAVLKRPEIIKDMKISIEKNIK